MTMWIFGAVFGCMSGMALFQFSLSNRILRLEVVLTAINKRAADILHSPHTPQLDVLLEKVASEGTLPKSNVGQFMEMLESIEKDLSNTKTERFLAALISCITFHAKKI